MSTEMQTKVQASPAQNFMPAQTGLLQRKSALCNTPGLLKDSEQDKEKLTLQRSSVDQAGTTTVPPIVHEVLRSPGQSLDHAARGYLEPRFGHDFSHVRIHTDDQASKSAQMVNALAYTVGRDIVFKAGNYDPGSIAGRKLLAHELVHVLQQNGSNAAFQKKLQIGSTHDIAEKEADHFAKQIFFDETALRMNPSIVSQKPPMLRRNRKGPQGVGEDDRRKVKLPTQTRGKDQVNMHVTRKFLPCPCRNVSDARTGIFYNPDLNNLAIAYRYCRGRTTTDVYGELQSNATAFLSGRRPEGTARFGIDVNIVGRRVGGRIVLEALGTNEGASEGIGGRAQIVFQGGNWRVFLEPKFIRRLRELPGGEAQNELQLSLGGQIGNFTTRLDLNDLLSTTRWRSRGTICIPVGRSIDICPFVEGGAGRGITGGFALKTPLGGPEVRQEKCYQCFCPPPVRKYDCREDVLPREELKPEQVERENTQEFRYYFKRNRTSPSEKSSLRAQSKANISALTSLVQAGAAVSLIYGYASPEASERHNQDLSENRARKMRELVQSNVGTDVQLPKPIGGGELLGSRPSPSPSSRLRDVISASGFRSAEELSFHLFGEEIPNAELAQQFISLFEALPKPIDRLALFGLTPADPIATKVLQMVDQFRRSRGRGHRPWKRIFRLLRFAVAHVVITEMVEQTSKVIHGGSIKTLSDSECQPFVKPAEQTGRFGKVDPNALKPTTSSAESNDDCLFGPRRTDERLGCKYKLPKKSRLRATAPSIAPREFR